MQIEIAESILRGIFADVMADVAEDTKEESEVDFEDDGWGDSCYVGLFNLIPYRSKGLSTRRKLLPCLSGILV